MGNQEQPRPEGRKNQPTSSQIKTSGKVLDGFWGTSPDNKSNNRLQGSSGSRFSKYIHRKQEHSRTLMRSGVKKPVSSEVRPPKVHPIKKTTGDLRTSGQTTWHSVVDPLRAARVKNLNKHKSVVRFGLSKAPLPASLVEAKTPVAAASPQKLKSIVKTNGSLGTRATNPVRPLASMITSVSHRRLERMLDHALHTARNHKQLSIPRGGVFRRLWHRIQTAPRWLSVGSGLTLVALVSAFFAYQNVPNFAMHIASARSQVDGSLPQYIPSGFRFAGPIQAADRSITVQFKANSDNERTFSIVQRVSDWDSNSLLANFVTPSITEEEQHQVSQDNKGKTIFIYGNENNATWVDGGVWYTIEDKADLNVDQLLKIAASL